MTDNFTPPPEGNLGESLPSRTSGNISPELANSFQTLKIETSNLQQQYYELKSQLIWVKVFFGLIYFLFGGLFVWSLIRFQDLEKMTQKLPANTASGQSSQMELVLQKISALEAKIPENLPDVIQGHDTQLQQLSLQLEQLRTQLSAQTNQNSKPLSPAPQPPIAPSATTSQKDVTENKESQSVEKSTP